jgi:hypothetical protein
MKNGNNPLYARFISRCVTYFLCLRKHSSLILNLLYLMIDSGLIINPNQKKVKLYIGGYFNAVIDHFKRDNKENS